MLNWADVDTVMFDMDGTLLDLHFDNYFWETLVPRTYGQRIGIDADAAWAQLRQHYHALHGKLDWYCIDFWSDKLQLDIQGMKNAARDKIALRPNVLPLLSRLQAHGKTVWLVTNAHPGSLDLKMQHTGLRNHFQHTVSSHDLGLAKENAGFWTTLRQLEHYDPERTVLFDDNFNVLARARAEGIRHLFGITLPDSQRPPVQHEEFICLHDFEQIMPPALETSDHGR
ncbi:GMP/IMP nucleotidase [Pseudohongiella sp.]|uniref:FCP1 homology domain-containing protein n=1 Tax=marine sediment metagenome TaxID=412755 RepID=A0A0F9WHX5_9ZZZZ|nr:GMP/IMP nucleotidase [Pseudohongiella sp.]HDZ07753.1 GMP/IMP nucleotidase [Pseudohongiella sp.]HEA62930.1 GMP/IMP nucleotidase [Pseudohongiella sp.]